MVGCKFLHRAERFHVLAPLGAHIFEGIVEGLSDALGTPETPPPQMRIPNVAAMLAALALVPLSHASAQDVAAAPTYGSAELSSGFMPDPHVIELTAGGDIAVNEGACNYGKVADAPDFDLYYTATEANTLYISAISGEDTTLLVNGPDGRWYCDDDSYGDLDPVIAIPKAQSGLYDIWVGTYGEELVSATLYISEVDPR